MFSNLIRFTALLCLILAVAIFTVPPLFFWLFALDPNITGDVMARRAAVLFLFPVTILWQFRDIDPASQTAKILAKSTAVTMLALALLGLSELALTRVGFGILIAVTTELVIFALWLKVLKTPSA